MSVVYILNHAHDCDWLLKLNVSLGYVYTIMVKHLG